LNGETEGLWKEASGSHNSDRQVFTVRQVNEEISAAISRAFPQTVWVRGEVQRMPHDAARRTHIYFELHETGASGAAEYQLSVSLMGWDRQKFGLGRYLDGSDPDFQIANQMEVCLECKVDFYAKFGKMSLKVVGVDKNFSLGRLEAQRRETLAHLEAQQLIGLNATVPMPELPLKVGLITSPGSAAEHDFTTGLAASPWGFVTHLVGAKMQGAQLQTEILRALEKQVQAKVDVIVITRGGGSRADLSWFDQQELAVAIAKCPLPVITAIGHEIDQSIADLVAHHSCKTPTAAAEYLVDLLDAAAGRLTAASDRLQVLVSQILLEAESRIDVDERLIQATNGALLRCQVRFQKAVGRLQQLVSHNMAARQNRLANLRLRLGSATSGHLSRQQARLQSISHQLGNSTRKTLKVAEQRVHQKQALLSAAAVRPLLPWSQRLDSYTTQARLLDPQRLLQRGYSISLGADGKAIKSVSELAAGDRLTTVLQDGKVKSIVQPGDAVGNSSGGKASSSGRKKGKTHSGQKALFR
jgi:exodeoxyribonuclease VII large subunit